jgi:hypothetical protein
MRLLAWLCVVLGIVIAVGSVTDAASTTAPESPVNVQLAPRTADHVSWARDPRPSTVTFPRTKVGVKGTDFTINGVPTFLLGWSYFDASNWRASDLDAIRANRFNFVRAVVDWGSDVSPLTAAGTWSSAAKRDALLAFVDACAARGIVVLFSILNPFSDQPAFNNHAAVAAGNRGVAISTVTATFAKKTNVLWDLMNEHDVDARFQVDGLINATHSDITNQRWKARILANIPGALWSISISNFTGGDVFYGPQNLRISAAQRANLAFHYAADQLNATIFLCHHHWSSNWFDLLDDRLTLMRAELTALGRRIPLIVDEEIGFGTSILYPPPAGTTDPTAAQYATAVTNARVAGAAGFIVHNFAVYDLRSQSMIQQLNAEAAVAMATIGVANASAPRAGIADYQSSRFRRSQSR